MKANLIGNNHDRLLVIGNWTINLSEVNAIKYEVDTTTSNFHYEKVIFFFKNGRDLVFNAYTEASVPIVEWYKKQLQLAKQNPDAAEQADYV